MVRGPEAGSPAGTDGPMARLIIGTRGSALALRQAAQVAAALRARHPGLEVVERVVRTAGDDSPSFPPASFETTGVFVQRIERALAAGEVDLAVHSLKDLPTEQPEDLVLVAVLERHDPRDALVSLAGWTLADLPAGTLVGTGSPRRRCQLLHHRPDLRLIPIRGNVDTRLLKLQQGELGALVLALAGLERLGITSVPFRALEPAQCLPAVGQGAIAVEIRRDDGVTAGLVAPLNHEPSSVRVVAERAFLRRLGGGCLAPATAHATFAGGQLALEAIVGDAEGRALLCERESGSPADGEIVGDRLARRLLAAGARRILEDARSVGIRGA